MKKTLLLSILYGGSTSIIKLLGFIIFIWIARTLPVVQYAQFGILYATQQGIIAFSIAGIYEGTIGLLKTKTTSIERNQLFNQSNFIFIFFSLLISVFLFGYFFFAGGFKIKTPLILLTVTGTGIIFGYMTLKAQLFRLLDNHTDSIIYIFFPPLFSFISGAILFFYNRTGDSFFFGSLIGLAISLVIVFFKNKKEKIVYNRADSKVLLLNSFPFILAAFLTWLSAYGNTYIVNAILTKPDVALFTFTLSLCSIMLIIAGSINQVWSPKFLTIIHHQPFEQVEIRNQKFYATLSFVLGVVSGFVVLIFPVGTKLVGGSLSQYSHATTQISFLFVAYVIQTPRWQYENHLLAHNYGKKIFQMYLISGVASVIVTITLLYTIGAMGVYIGFAFKFLLHTILTYFVTKKRWKIILNVREILMGVCFIIISNLLLHLVPSLIFQIIGYTLSVAILGYISIKQDGIFNILKLKNAV